MNTRDRARSGSESRGLDSAYGRLSGSRRSRRWSELSATSARVTVRWPHNFGMCDTYAASYDRQTFIQSVRCLAVGSSVVARHRREHTDVKVNVTCRRDTGNQILTVFRRTYVTRTQAHQPVYIHPDNPAWNDFEVAACTRVKCKSRLAYDDTVSTVPFSVFRVFQYCVH